MLALPCMLGPKFCYRLNIPVAVTVWVYLTEVRMILLIGQSEKKILIVFKIVWRVALRLHDYCCFVDCIKCSDFLWFFSCIEVDHEEWWNQRKFYYQRRRDIIVDWLRDRAELLKSRQKRVLWSLRVKAAGRFKAGKQTETKRILWCTVFKGLWFIASDVMICLTKEK